MTWCSTRAPEVRLPLKGIERELLASLDPETPELIGCSAVPDGPLDTRNEILWTSWPDDAPG
jgi:hypothetical protein